MLDSEIYFERVNSANSSYYDFSNSVYNGMLNEITAVCKNCGKEVTKRAEHFLERRPHICQRKKTTEQFIKEANSIHNFKYDYSKTNYINNKTKVIIICPIHGEFLQDPHKHLQGQGCIHCNKFVSFEDFLKRANTENYDFLEFNGMREYTTAKCKKCGEIVKRRATYFLDKFPHFCSKRKTLEEFEKGGRKIFGDKFEYLEYTNAKTKAKIKCRDCGMIFYQKPWEHFKGFYGCNCQQSSVGENTIKKYLEDRNISYERNKEFKDLKDKDYLSYDFYLLDKNILIEYNGEQHYEKKCFNGNRKKFLIQKHHDWLKRRYAKKNNIKLVVIPYWENIENILEEYL